MIAVLIIQGHNSTYHHHDLSHRQTHSHHEEGHNTFSYVDLDEAFTLQSRTGIADNSFVADVPPGLSGLAVLQPVLTRIFVAGDEDAPPGPYLLFKSSRAPPLYFIC